MGRSQRRMILTTGSNAAGAVHDEGVTAPGLVLQIEPAPPPGKEMREGEPIDQLEVPHGPEGGPLQGSSLTGPIPEGANIPYPPNPNPPGPDPEPGMEPVLNSINPSSARIGDADLTMNVNGNRFTEWCTIYFNNGPEQTTFNSTSQLSTTVKPSTATTPGSYPVYVQMGSYKTTSKDFTFLPENTVEEEGDRTFPAGPFAINRVEDHADGIACHMMEGDIRVGDAVLIEATGNTSINGAYTVLSVSQNVIVVDNDVTLETPIEAKGRVTVNGEAG